MILFCVSFDKFFFFWFRYDPTDDSWTELPPMKIPRVLAGSVVFKDKIYVIGKYIIVIYIDSFISTRSCAILILSRINGTKSVQINKVY